MQPTFLVCVCSFCQVYAKSDRAKDCRGIAQEYNMQRGKMEEAAAEAAWSTPAFASDMPAADDGAGGDTGPQAPSKWEKYVVWQACNCSQASLCSHILAHQSDEEPTSGGSGAEDQVSLATPTPTQHPVAITLVPCSVCA